MFYDRKMLFDNFSSKVYVKYNYKYCKSLESMPFFNFVSKKILNIITGYIFIQDIPLYLFMPV